LGLLLPFYSLGSDFRSIEDALSFEFAFAYKPVFICSPNQHLPVIFYSEERKIDQAIWGIQSQMANSKSFPWVRMEGIIKNIHTRTLIRKNRCLIPANGFFIQVQSEKYFIYFPKEKVVTFGAVWKLQKDKDSDRQSINYSIISCQAQGKINKLSNRIPLVIHKSNRRKFLKKENPLMDISRILKKDNKLDFNGFSVNPEIFYKTNISKRDFIPSGEKLYKAKQFPEKAILGSYYYFHS